MPTSPTTFLERYDLIVLGSGPGGQRAAVQAAKLKKSVLIVEKEKIGGSCLHTGTIPSKTLREAAIQSAGMNSLGEVMSQKKRVIDGESSVIQEQLQRNDVHLILGTGSFLSPNEVAVSTTEGIKTFHATYIVIATGTHPNRPTSIPFNSSSVHDSDTILSIDHLPSSLAILGAGVIGSEYASIFARLGVRVTMLDRRNTLLRGIDADILKILTQHFVTMGIELKLSTEMPTIRAITHQGRPMAECTFGNEKRVFEAVLYCMGRDGNTADLNLKNAGVDADDRGMLKVNEHYQTAVSNIFAVGDIIGFPALAASSGEQGRLAANFMFGKDGGKFPDAFPYGIYTIPEISCAGLHEVELHKSATPFVVGRAFYKELARGKILNDDNGFLKLLVHKTTKKLLGVHIIGTGATELVHIGQVAMALGADIEFLVNNVFNYPTLAEAYKVAAYNAYNQLR